jgi:hypothetical protein
VGLLDPATVPGQTPGAVAGRAGEHPSGQARDGDLAGRAVSLVAEVEERVAVTQAAQAQPSDLGCVQPGRLRERVSGLGVQVQKAAGWDGDVAAAWNRPAKPSQDRDTARSQVKPWASRSRKPAGDSSGSGSRLRGSGPDGRHGIIHGGLSMKRAHRASGQLRVCVGG